MFDQNDLNYRLKWAISRGDLSECRELLLAGAGRKGSLSSCEQASWLNSAIHAGQHSAELVDLLLETGLDANSLYDEIGDDYQSTPIVTAAKAGRLDLMEKLVAAGADFHWCSPTGANAASETLPSLASQAPCLDNPKLCAVREWLSQRGVRIDPASADSRRKLSWAASNPFSWPDVEVLLNLGVDRSVLAWTPFMMKLARNEANLEEAALLPPAELAHKDSDKRTPFLMAVAAGRIDLAKILLQAGSDLHARGWCGATALHLAAEHDHDKLIAWLVELGMEIDIHDDFHHTPLRKAVGHNKLRATQRLLSLGANVEAGDENGYHVVHDASSLEIFEILIRANVEINHVSGGGCWPLKDAAESGSVDLVRFLLKHGANPNLTSTGATALFGAVSSDSLECISLLLSSGAEINAQDCDGWTCLWNVRSLTVAQMLLDHGADPSITDQCDSLPETWGSLPGAASSLLAERRMATGNP